MSRSKILFQLSGSIACYKACNLISKLVQDGHEVQAVATDSALRFVGQATLEGLTRKSVFTNLFEPGQMMSHIHLAKWADLAIVCPATADTINGLAHGQASDPIGTLFLAYDLKSKTFLIAQAMNQTMLSHPATQASLGILESWGVRIMPVGIGSQACGDMGEGRLLEPETLFEEMSRFL